MAENLYRYNNRMQPTITNVRFQLRRDTATAWSSALNPKLLEGEPGYDTTNKILKIGDGITTWSLLPSISGGSGAGATGGASLPVNGAVGDYLSWTGTQWVAGGGDDVKLGGNSSITGTAKNNVVVGSTASAVEGDVTIGQGAASNFKFNVSVGLGTVANGYDVAVGANVNTGGNDVGIGSSVTSNGYDVAIGSTAKSYGNAVAIGANSKSSTLGVSVGNRAISSGTLGSISIGTNSTANNVTSVAVGASSISAAANGVAIGPIANVSDGSDSAIAMGNLTTVNPASAGAVVIGSQSSVDKGSIGSIVIGGLNTLRAANSILINAGYNADTQVQFATPNACYINPIRGVNNPFQPFPRYGLWYDPTTYELCYQP